METSTQEKPPSKPKILLKIPKDRFQNVPHLMLSYLPVETIELLNKLTAAGFKCRWIGGGLRDAYVLTKLDTLSKELLIKTLHDIDIVVTGGNEKKLIKILDQDPDPDHPIWRIYQAGIRHEIVLCSEDGFQDRLRTYPFAASEISFVFDNGHFKLDDRLYGIADIKDGILCLKNTDRNILNIAETQQVFINCPELMYDIISVSTRYEIKFNLHKNISSVLADGQFMQGIIKNLPDAGQKFQLRILRHIYMKCIGHGRAKEFFQGLLDYNLMPHIVDTTFSTAIIDIIANLDLFIFNLKPKPKYDDYRATAFFTVCFYAALLMPTLKENVDKKYHSLQTLPADKQGNDILSLVKAAIAQQNTVAIFASRGMETDLENFCLYCLTTYYLKFHEVKCENPYKNYQYCAGLLTAVGFNAARDPQQSLEPTVTHTPAIPTISPEKKEITRPEILKEKIDPINKDLKQRTLALSSKETSHSSKQTNSKASEDETESKSNKHEKNKSKKNKPRPLYSMWGE